VPRELTAVGASKRYISVWWVPDGACARKAARRAFREKKRNSGAARACARESASKMTCERASRAPVTPIPHTLAMPGWTMNWLRQRRVCVVCAGLAAAQLRTGGRALALASRPQRPRFFLEENECASAAC
jgi:hypothetical protein